MKAATLTCDHCQHGWLGPDSGGFPPEARETADGAVVRGLACDQCDCEFELSITTRSDGSVDQIRVDPVGERCAAGERHDARMAEDSRGDELVNVNLEDRT